MLALAQTRPGEIPETGLTVIIGHTNSDLDCFGSMVLARYLYPEARIARSALVHPVARNLYHLYGGRLGMVHIDELRGEEIARIVIVDTRTRSRIDEYFSGLEGFGGEIIILDHHPADDYTIPATRVVERKCGANTTLLALELMERGLRPSEDDATIALTGIFADTGNFTHDNVTEDDFAVAAWLRSCGASPRLVRNFLKPLSDKYQITLFHDLLNSLVYHEVRGHFVVLAEMHVAEQTGGLAAIVEKVHEVESPDATFVVFGFRRENSVLIVARSQRETINVNRLLAPFGGGGHDFAGSAYIKGGLPGATFTRLIAALESDLQPAWSAQDVMLYPAHSIGSAWPLKEASIFLERINQTGAPVVDDDGGLVGMLTLRDIMKGRKHNQMHAPVSAYMARKVVSVGLMTPMRTIEELIHEHNIAHLPVVEEERVIGIITREEVIEFISQQSRRERVIVENARAAAISLEEKGDEHGARPDP